MSSSTTTRLGKARPIFKSSTISISITGFKVDEKSPLCRVMDGHLPYYIALACVIFTQSSFRTPRYIGKSVMEKFNAGDGNLPFLFTATCKNLGTPRNFSSCANVYINNRFWYPNMLKVLFR
ncbi:hypothetical protein BYT27DRAFT_6892870 [Phlegmacium glaucopus]|nr:hypothetical protein BYT27DRAFT_6892870 [Phlegmacium glaucopus]